jgi:hypothetical protein
MPTEDMSATNPGKGLSPAVMGVRHGHAAST